MRIDKLTLPSFRNLRNFSVDFDEASPRTVLVGRNGVGKTNILEALTRIFRQLDLGEESEFAYRIEYVCNRHRIEVTATPERLDVEANDAQSFITRFRIIRDDEAPTNEWQTLSAAAFHRLNENSQTRLLPKHVFGYYSGTSGRFREIFHRHRERYREQLIRGTEKGIRSLFLAEEWHSQFVLLAFFSKPDSSIGEFLRDELRIVGLESVLFVLQEPPWYQKNPSAEVRERGDSRYWWAAGTVRELLTDLHNHALAPMKTVERTKINFKTSNLEHRYLYLKSAADLQLLTSEIDQKELFKRLESTVLSELLSEVRIRFTTADSEQSLSFNDLSEGEQQLLTVLGLLRFTNQDESLFLLDEPDTHLNPAWSLGYLEILNKYGGGLQNSQIIMATHSPLLFAGLERNEVILLQRSEDDVIEAHHPLSDPKGMGFNAILTSEFFGLRAALDRETTELLDEKRSLGSRDVRTASQEARLNELNDILRSLDFRYAATDPLLSEFSREMAKLELHDPQTKQVVLSAAALKKRREYAEKAARRIKEKERGG